MACRAINFQRRLGSARGAEGAAPLSPEAGRDELVPVMGSGLGLLVPQLLLGPSAAPGSIPQQLPGGALWMVSLGWGVGHSWQLP